jgi:hypothetical protein
MLLVAVVGALIGVSLGGLLGAGYALVFDGMTDVADDALEAGVGSLFVGLFAGALVGLLGGSIGGAVRGALEFMQKQALVAGAAEGYPVREAPRPLRRRLSGLVGPGLVVLAGLGTGAYIGLALAVSVERGNLPAVMAGLWVGACGALAGVVSGLLAAWLWFRNSRLG